MKRRGGFPKGPPRPIRISLALSLDEYMLFRQAWEDEEMRQSDWMRCALARAAVREALMNENMKPGSTEPTDSE